MPLFVMPLWSFVVTRLLAYFVSFLSALTLSGCVTPPAQLDLSLSRATEQGRYVVTLQPPAVPPVIDQIHSWQVKVTSPAGAAVADARIAVDGGMPQPASSRAWGRSSPTR